MKRSRFIKDKIISILKDVFAELMVTHGVPEHIRSDNGPERVVEELRNWLEHMGTKTAYIDPGSPWENGYCESFNWKAAGRAVLAAQR